MRLSSSSAARICAASPEASASSISASMPCALRVELQRRVDVRIVGPGRFAFFVVARHVDHAHMRIVFCAFRRGDKPAPDWAGWLGRPAAVRHLALARLGLAWLRGFLHGQRKVVARILIVIRRCEIHRTAFALCRARAGLRRRVLLSPRRSPPATLRAPARPPSLRAMPCCLLNAGLLQLRQQGVCGAFFVLWCIAESHLELVDLELLTKPS